MNWKDNLHASVLHVYICHRFRSNIVLHLPSLVQALLARCRCLSSVSLLDAPHISDIALTAIAEAAKLKTFNIAGEIILDPPTFVSKSKETEH